MGRAVTAATILACVLGLAACDDDNGTSKSPASSTGATAGDAKSSPAQDGDGAKTGTPLAGVDPCTLLKPVCDNAKKAAGVVASRLTA